MALGKEDFGLFGLIGSLVIFLSFINTQFAGALARFYAHSIGRAKVADDKEQALEECRKWFSVGVVIHTLLPVVLVLIGYPIGAWAIESGVVGVPVHRVVACVWLWRFVCISAFVFMVNVPFNAMYVAKQYIAELTVYSLAQTLVRTAFVYFMTLREADWLVTYGFAMCLVMVIPQIIICVRAVVVFTECRLRIRYISLWDYMKQLASFAGWQTFGGLGFLARHQFLTVVVNRVFGPKTTASFSVGCTVGSEASALTGALQSAFAPAITTACGEGDWRRMRVMAYQASKFGTLLTLLFAIPMGLEIEELLRLWLKDVPQWSEGICVAMLGVVVVEKFSLGHIIGVNASGRVARFQVFRGLACFTAVPFSMVAVVLWRHVYAVAAALLLTTCIACCSDVWLARTRIGLSARYWLSKIIVPIGVVSTIVCGIGLLPRLFMLPSFMRIVVTTVFTIFALVPLAWLLVLDTEERQFVLSRVATIRNRLFNNG